MFTRSETGGPLCWKFQVTLRERAMGKRQPLTRSKAVRLLSVCLLCRSVKAFQRDESTRLQAPQAGKRSLAQRVLTKGETMTRYPSLKSSGGLLRTLDWAGTIAFASGGAVCAANRGMDLLGCLELAVITAMGGGTTRDILLGQTPVFWLQETEYLAMCLVTGALTFLVWPYINKSTWVSSTGYDDDGPLCRWADTIGLGAFAVVGTQHGIRKGLPNFVTVVIATVTCSFGGIVRDVFTRTAIRVLHSNAELYASTAAAGSVAYLLARKLISEDHPLLRMSAGFTVTVLLRYLAWTHQLKLPHMRK